jgi:hypothetical protein
VRARAPARTTSRVNVTNKHKEKAVNEREVLTKKDVDRLEAAATRFLNKHGYAWNGESLENEQKRLREKALFDKKHQYLPSLKVK